MEQNQLDIVATTTKEINPEALKELQAFLVSLDLKYQLKSLVITPRPIRQ